MIVGCPFRLRSRSALVSSVHRSHTPASLPRLPPSIRHFSYTATAMGIHGLSKVLGDNAESSMKENEIKNYFGRKVAIDASMSIYQFLIAVRQQDGMQLSNEFGETTSHLMGMFYRTIRMVENGIKPCYVFDGKPPDMKSSELQKRGERRAEAQKAAEVAKEEGDAEAAEKYERRTVKVTKEHNAECQKLLKLMGIPYIEAPSEAEAQCAALAKAGKVYAAGSEDMDTLTFGSPVLLRRLTFSEARKLPISEVHLDRVLEGLGFTMDQFIDLCILLGCDYCDSIKGIGPHRAVALIREHGSIEKILENLDTKKYPVSENWPYQQARELFRNPEVLDPSTIDLKWEQPDEEGLVEFMVKEKSFNEDRIRGGAKKLQKNFQTATQGRLDSFFKPIPKSPTSPEAKKRKEPPGKKAAPSKKGKPTSPKGRR
ncbi:PIN domain-like protein [Polychytrium aggregatum]|uniref:PIN domain-like protein n=1 Tax=Polychytrium aggregatum TaxID=110093 RepID=UPI0022FEE0BD|nr:PIN domain-like protein [Polychytrium aggregatum]KAI9207101.1 PIN domain-like protein [Polychytrium aggregatum]